MKRIFTILLFFISLAVNVKTYAKTVTFAQISDTHVSLSGTDYRGRNVTQSAEYLKQAIKQINANKDIEFVLFTGDMIDVADRDDLVAFLRVANKLNKPYYIIIGNHEVFRYQNFNKKNYMHTVWLHHLPMLFKNTNYVVKINKELVFIFVDGANELFPGPSGYFTPKTLAWVDKQLKKYKNKKVVLVQHFPLIPPSKKVSHNTVDADKYFHVINSYDNVIAIISGHFHYNNTIYRKGIYHLSAPGFVMRPHQYKIITIEYEPKYLFSDPAEFSIKQQLIPMEADNDFNSIFGLDYTEGNK